MKRIRVLHIIKSLNLGGAESNLYNLACAFDRQKVKCYVAYSIGGPFELKLKEAGIRLYKYETKDRKVKSSASLLIILKLAVYILRRRINVVHTHNYNAHVWGSIAARMCGVRVVEHVHDSRYESNAFLKDKGLPETAQFDQARYFARFSSRIAVLTTTNRDYLIDNDVVPANRIRLLLNGIPLDGNGRHGQDLKAELCIPNEKRIVFTAMRLALEKNAEMVVGIANLLKERNDVVFIVAGEGPQKGYLEQRAIDMGLAKKIMFVGYRPDIKDFLSIADIFILPTLRELHSISMIEAMSMRVPALVSKGAGCNDYFIHKDVNGFLLNPRVADEWASVIKRLLDNEPLRKKVGEAGRKLVEKECDVKKIAADFTGMYAELCGHKAS